MVILEQLIYKIIVVRPGTSWNKISACTKLGYISTAITGLIYQLLAYRTLLPPDLYISSQQQKGQSQYTFTFWCQSCKNLYNFFLLFSFLSEHLSSYDSHPYQDVLHLLRLPKAWSSTFTLSTSSILELPFRN